MLQYRFFAFWDKTGKTQALVVSTHGIVKKVGEVPVNEIEKAMKMRMNYFEFKD